MSTLRLENVHKLKHFDVTVVSSSVKWNSLRQSPNTYVAVACGDAVQITEVMSGAGTINRNKTFHFSIESGETGIASSGRCTISLFHQEGSESVLLGQIIEDLNEIEHGIDITRELADGTVSLTFRVGNGTKVRRIYALIIGINEYYISENNLKGCISDAEDMESFLVNDLGTPKGNLVILHNEAATRQGILDAIKSHLIENPKIEYGDAMVIFYAGHGARVPSPDGWPSPDGMIETICPYDECALDTDGNEITGIPDRTVNELIRRLAEAKGNNITLIFDSCHSGGIARSEDEVHATRYKSRLFDNPCPISSTIDAAIWGEIPRGAYAKLPPGFRHADMESHVLLSACRPTQRAYENPQGKTTRGFFSSNLLPKLREYYRNSQPMTYSTLMEETISAMEGVTLSEKGDPFPLSKLQMPQCHGKNKDFYLFSLQGSIKSRSRFKLHQVDGRIEVNLGSIHGIVEGSEFLLIQGPTEDHRRILVASKVYSRRSILIFQTEQLEVLIPENAEVSIWNWNNKSLVLKVFTQSQEVKNHILATDTLYSGHALLLVDTMVNAHLAISMTADKKYEFTRLPEFMPGQDIKGKSQGIADNIFNVLGAICHFRYHLLRDASPQDKITVGTGLSTAAHVKMQLLPVTGAHSADSTTQDCFNDQSNAILSANDTANYAYGFKLTNNYTASLFPYLFYFDPADYSIQEWYLPPAHNMNPPLGRARSMTIGYGANGGDPFAFDLQGEKEGTGFVKLFVSTRYADMEHLIQSSPFCHSFQPYRIERPLIKDVTGSLVASITVVSP